MEEVCLGDVNKGTVPLRHPVVLPSAFRRLDGCCFQPVGVQSAPRYTEPVAPQPSDWRTENEVEPEKGIVFFSQ
ncbi:unnamed protein product [Arctogadus glacialis]